MGDTKWVCAQCRQIGPDAIAKYIRAIRPDEIDLLRGKLRIGLHNDVEVTDAVDKHPLPVVSQAICSALPVAYSRVPAAHWKRVRFACLRGQLTKQRCGPLY